MSKTTFSIIGSLSSALLSVVSLQMCSGLENITAHLGQNITLPCSASINMTPIAVEWTRPDLTPDVVFFYLGKSSNERQQHQSFNGRVDLVDRLMKDGNLSLVLMNVTANDSGTYECRVKEKVERRRIRSVIESPPINTIRLTVTPSGEEPDEEPTTGPKKGGNVWLTVVLPVLVVGVVIIIIIITTGFVINRKKKTSYQLPPEQGCNLQETRSAGCEIISVSSALDIAG
ncbi:butyrophilin subfamily 1 member A1-like [Anabas testudineus]|uniref:butyrophilin subfamily 1 member A1-like n=1 Tax=Anabas testudineus TaxID=64144 RepID=UPI000E45B149|nr:butyrophilin subfamily 1 member A1-like [Anabas testudineus]